MAEEEVEVELAAPATGSEEAAAASVPVDLEMVGLPTSLRFLSFCVQCYLPLFRCGRPCSVSLATHQRSASSCRCASASYSTIPTTKLTLRVTAGIVGRQSEREGEVEGEELFVFVGLSLDAPPPPTHTHFPSLPPAPTCSGLAAGCAQHAKGTEV